MQVTQKVRNAVALGAAVLDKHFGHPSWRRKCEGFAIWSPYNCILGKLFETLHKGAYVLKLDCHGLEAHGFERFNETSYEELQQAWEDEFANPPLGTDDEPESCFDPQDYPEFAKKA